MPNPAFARCLYGDQYTEGSYIFLAEALIAQNSFTEPCLDDLEVDDEVLLYSTDGRNYLGAIKASPADVKAFRKLVAAKVCKRIYSIPLDISLKELTDDELDCLLIHRGLNS